jgi:hypothetical protein
VKESKSVRPEMGSREECFCSLRKIAEKRERSELLARTKMEQCIWRGEHGSSSSAGVIRMTSMAMETSIATHLLERIIASSRW